MEYSEVEVKTDTQYNFNSPKEECCSKYNIILSKIASSSPIISKIEWSHKDVNGRFAKDGTICFRVGVHDLGLMMQDVYFYTQVIFSRFVVDFMGELIVRNNINKFVELMTDLEENAYNEIVNKKWHAHFGIKLDAGNEEFIMSFHINFVQQILIEDFGFHVR